jgi:hypothetical protein
VSRTKAALATIVLIALAVYWRTAYPTITWWDSGSYSLVAGTLGVAAPPGSLLLTLLGWPFTQIPFASSPGRTLNLVAACLAAIAVGLVYVVGLRILRQLGVGVAVNTGRMTGATIVGAALGALTFAFTDTLWEHAIKFTPYVLTAVFTALILLTMVRWWQDADLPDAWRAIALLGLLFGLDFSVHRTNALLLPSALAWILIRRPRTLAEPRTWLAGGSAMAVGLAVQLLVAPIAAFTKSPWNWGMPDTWPRFWSYVSLEERGGGFLVQFFPRNSPFWSFQVTDFLRVLGDNFFDLSILGALPAVLALLGLAALWLRDRRFGTAFSIGVFLHAATTVLYFNIPAGYFRPFDRHYLPVCVTISVAAACGLGSVMDTLGGFRATAGRRLIPIAAVIVLLLPGSRLVSNWADHDASRRWFTRDYAANALANLPPNAIYFTIGDNDTFPVQYLQAVEGVRRDVSIVNLNMLNFPTYLDHISRRDPLFAIVQPLGQSYESMARAWTDTTLAIPVSGTAATLGLADDAVISPTISLRAGTTNGSGMLPVDLMVLDVLRANRWRRPITFATTVGSGGMGWLQPYGRLDGTFWRVVPVADPRPVVDLLRDNLLSNEYRGYADSSSLLETPTRAIGMLYHSAFRTLQDAERRAGAFERCRADTARFLAMVPFERLTSPASSADATRSDRCVSSGVSGSPDSHPP